MYVLSCLRGVLLKAPTSDILHTDKHLHGRLPDRARRGHSISHGAAPVRLDDVEMGSDNDTALEDYAEYLQHLEIRSVRLASEVVVLQDFRLTKGRRGPTLPYALLPLFHESLKFDAE